MSRYYGRSDYDRDKILTGAAALGCLAFAGLCFYNAFAPVDSDSNPNKSREGKIDVSEFYFANKDKVQINTHKPVQEYLRSEGNLYLFRVELQSPNSHGTPSVNASFDLTPSDIKAVDYADLNGAEVIHIQTFSGKEMMFPMVETTVYCKDASSRPSNRHHYEITITAQKCYLLVPDDVAKNIEKAVADGTVDLNRFMSWEEANQFIKDMSGVDVGLSPENTDVAIYASDTALDDMTISGESLLADSDGSDFGL